MTESQPIGSLFSFFRRRWATVWRDGEVEQRFFTRRFAEHHARDLNGMAGAMGSTLYVTVERVNV